MQTPAKYRLIPYPRNFQDFSAVENVKRLNQQLRSFVEAINNDRTYQTMPCPEELLVEGGSGKAVVSWADVGNEYRPDLDGARVWRADAATDPDLRFDVNSNREIVVRCMRTTKYVDLEVAAGDYIYWVQWINLEGNEGPVAGGYAVTVT